MVRRSKNLPKRGSPRCAALPGSQNPKSQVASRKFARHGFGPAACDLRLVTSVFLFAARVAGLELRDELVVQRHRRAAVRPFADPIELRGWLVAAKTRPRRIARL